MTKLSDLPAHLQEFIRTADFNHYYCWRVVYKEDSQSTPARLVVDLTMSGLNILLAKDENNLGNFFDILISVGLISSRGLLISQNYIICFI